MAPAERTQAVQVNQEVERGDQRQEEVQDDLKCLDRRFQEPASPLSHELVGRGADFGDQWLDMSILNPSTMMESVEPKSATV